MEATSDYWKPVFYLLKAHGLQPWLVNARDVRHLPGRPKTDVLDAQCSRSGRQKLGALSPRSNSVTVPGILFISLIFMCLFFIVAWRALDDDTETGPYLAFAGVLLTAAVTLLVAGWK